MALGDHFINHCIPQISVKPLHFSRAGVHVLNQYVLYTRFELTAGALPLKSAMNISKLPIVTYAIDILKRKGRHQMLPLVRTLSAIDYVFTRHSYSWAPNHTWFTGQIHFTFYLNTAHE